MNVRGIIASLFAALAVASSGHDIASDPHVTSCDLSNGGTTITCLYQRHQTGEAARFRAGYAEHGNYVLSCALGAGGERSHTTTICRAGVAAFGLFRCWDADAQYDWLRENADNRRSDRVGVTEEVSLQGVALQRTMLKVLVAPERVGRPHFAHTSAKLNARYYAEVCGIEIDERLGIGDLGSVIPALRVFGATKVNDGGG